MFKIYASGFKYCTFIVLTSIFCILSSVIVEAEEKASALDRIDYQLAIYPQEKLHVVTDRDIYCGGDTIWMRVFVVDAASHKQTAISKYAYVELLNPFGKTQKRVKLIERDGVYAGYLPINENVFEGDYTLAAYTTYAENQGKDFFFRKNLRILAPYSSKYYIESEFTPSGESEVKGNFALKSVDGTKMNYNIMSWTMPDGKTLEMPDSKKGFSKKFSRAKNENVVLVKFGDYGKYFRVEYPSEKTEIAFYPEGGWLVPDEYCTVAFKVTDENGNGVEANGIVKDSSGKEITRFATSHRGMGCFSFIPEEGNTYMAEYIGPDAEPRNKMIGSPKEGSVALHYQSSGSGCTFSVAGGKGKDLELVLACRGIGILSSPISDNTAVTIEKSDLPTGLYQAFLVSPKDNKVFSERIFFIGADRDMPDVLKIDSDSLNILLTSNDRIPGDCSVRIVNNKLSPSQVNSDIRTQLLLQSELRGRIEDPAYYFNINDPGAERNLDLLMMINGWSRYNISDAISGHFNEPDIPLEIGQEITGQVRSRWKGKPLEDIIVSAIAPKYNFGTFTNTDKNGYFHLNGFDFPEGTPFIFRAMNVKGGNEGNYDIFNDHYPDVDILINSSPAASVDAVDFFKGIRWTMLDEIKVQAFKNDDMDIYQSLATYSRDSEDMSKRGITSLEEVLRSIPGITNKQNRWLWRNKYIAFYIDGTLFETAGGSNTSSGGGVAAMPLGSLPGTYHTPRAAKAGPDIHEIRKKNIVNSMASTVDSHGTQSNAPTLSDIEDVIPFQAIDRIDFIRPELFVMGEHYGGGVIMISSKSGNGKHWAKQFELKDYLPLGYQQYKEYASPILSADADEYDLQTQPTLLWIPSVKFDDNGKTIDLKFPINSNHRVIIEGVAENGDLIYNTL